MKFISILFSSCCVLFASCKQINTEISTLRCNQKTEATGVGMHPVFNWQTKSDLRSVSQTAYQIIISDEISEIRKNKGNVWNSGKVNSSESIQISYNGNELKSATTYYAKVKTWNNHGEETNWSKAISFITGVFDDAEWETAKWIAAENMTTNRVVPGLHSWGNDLRKLDLPVTIIPYFRKSFEIKNKLKSAILLVSGVGQYEAYVNGQKVGDDFLSPAWSHYDKTVYYNTYDLTELLHDGKNVLGSIVGNGFYNINRERYRKLVIAYGKPSFVCKLILRYDDGSVEEIVSDESWKWSASPITFTSIYSGENYDARMEQEGWSDAGFNDSDWKPVVISDVKGSLIAQEAYPLKVMESFVPVTVNKLNTDTFVYDFGQNASGIIEITVKGKKGDTIRIWPGELLKDNGEVNQRATGRPYYYEYILNGNGIETWRPRFTYYGFRYVQVERAVVQETENVNGSPVVQGIKHLHTRSSMPQTGDFNCSNEIFNKTNKLISYAIKSNLTTVMTDCPHREKLGWLEQTFLMGGSVHYNFDVYHLYKKLIADMMDAQRENGMVPNIVPEYVVFGGAFTDSPEWGSASVILPWLLYKWYGDKNTLQKTWPMMQKYMDYLSSKAENNLLFFGLGDWYDLGPNRPGFSQLTPEGLTASAIYYYDAELMIKVADLFGDAEKSTAYAQLALNIKNAFNTKFYNQKTGVYGSGSQTSQAIPYCVGLVENDEMDKVVQRLCDSIEANNNELTTGDIGFHFLIEALTKAGKSSLIYKMNNREDVPGYGFQIKKGATALTESWQALPDVSNNHLMLGHIMQWFYEGLAGIKMTDTSIAYKKFSICPEILDGMDHAEATIESIYGQIKSSWKRQGDSILLKCEVPVNSQAILSLRAPINMIKEGGLELRNVNGVTGIVIDDNITKMKLGSGKYAFSFTLN